MLMTRLSTYAPGSFVNTVRRELDEAFSQAFGNSPANTDAPTRLPLTIWEDDGSIHVQADVPGFDRESVDLQFHDGKLWIRAERKVAGDDGNYWHNERMFGRFERAVAMPEIIDPESIEAELVDGVLTVSLKKKPESRPMKISIKGTENGDMRLTEASH